MKKSILLFALLFCSNFAFAQFTTSGANLYHTGGNVGIGTTAPSQLLTLNSGSNVYLRITKPQFQDMFDIGITSHYADIAYTAGTSTNSNFRFLTNGNTKMYIQYDGNVGIGTTSPESSLHVNSATSRGLRFTRSGANVFGFEIGGTTFGLYDYTDGEYRWRTGNGNVLINESGGNVGIGTTSPFGDLELSDGGDTQLQMTSTSNFGNVELSFLNSFDNHGFKQFLWQGGDQLHFNFGSEFNGGVNATTNIMTMHGNGNIGIGTGTTSPTAKLQIASDHSTFLQKWATPNQSDAYFIYNGQSDDNGYFTGLEAVSGNQNFRLHTKYDSFLAAESGNVGIGTTSPTEKLSVDGNILSKKVRVSIDASDWPDYVFANSYKPMAISKLEKYIQQNGHLPEVPSAKEIEKEGLDLGSMDATLLKKVEELTLYMIEMKKEIDVLKEENKELRKKIQ